MSLIPREEMTELKPASELKAVAETAAHEIEVRAVAAILNNAANTGVLSASVESPLSDELVSELKAKGYDVKQNLVDDAAHRKSIITWGNA